MSTHPSLPNALERALAILSATRDIVEGRPVEGITPTWAEQRGWSDYLLRLSHQQLLEAERAPAAWLAAQIDAPPSLHDLAEQASHLCAHFEDVSEPVRHLLERHVKQRKQAQLDAFAEVASREFAGVLRVVDFGAGHGHLTRALALALNPRETLGVDWHSGRVARAIALAGNDGPRFAHADASRSTDDTLSIASGDLVVGLHPCGDLGDTLVARAREAGAHVLAVSCCFQETPRESRPALSTQGRLAGFSVPKRALGLANLSPVSFDGSGTVAERRARRRTRLALRFLLEARGVEIAPGEEARGVPKDRVRQGLAEVATLALAKRGLGAATAIELAQAQARAEEADIASARLSLPRNALARVLELAIVLDRARSLEEAGWRARVDTLFSSRTSPRNLAIVAVAPR